MTTTARSVAALASVATLSACGSPFADGRLFLHPDPDVNRIEIELSAPGNGCPVADRFAFAINGDAPASVEAFTNSDGIILPDQSTLRCGFRMSFTPVGDPPWDFTSGTEADPVEARFTATDVTSCAGVRIADFTGADNVTFVELTCADGSRAM